MYKSQLQEIAQRSCTSLPSYACIREGPDHAPLFKAVVNFNGERFDSPTFCGTLKQAEHAAAEVALGALLKRGPIRSLAARVLDETGVYKNLLQETTDKAGFDLPIYTTVRSGPGHNPVFTCTVELAGLIFMGDPAKTKKQSQKNAAMTAWSALIQLPYLLSSSSTLVSNHKEKEQVVVARALAKLHSSDWRKSTPKKDRHRKSGAPIQEKINQRTNKKPSFENWMQSDFLPEVAKHQENPRQKSQYVSPIVQSTDHHHGNYLSSFSDLPEPMSSSPLFFSRYTSPLTLGGRSQVSIEEIHDGKGKVPNNQRISNPSNSMAFPKYEATDPLSVGGFDGKQANVWSNFPRMFCEGKTNMPTAASDSHPLVANGSCIGRNVNYHLSFLPKNPWEFDSTGMVAPSLSRDEVVPDEWQSTGAMLDGFRTSADSFLPSPVNIRTAVPVCTSRSPGVLSFNSFAVSSSSSNFMDPEFQLESAEPDDIFSMATSRFGKLRI